MPYANIHWIKLEKRLLNDHRFYTMSEESQLIYVKLLLLSAETNNKIPKNPALIKTALRSQQPENKIQECLKEIQDNFPKFKQDKNFYRFAEWSTRHNWILKKELQGNSEGVPKEPENRIDKNRIDKIRINYCSAKGYSLEKFLPDDFSRTAKAIKTLITKADGNDDLVVKAFAWAGKQNWCDWTLETLIRKWPDYLKNTIKTIRIEKPESDCEICNGTGKLPDGPYKGCKCFCVH